MTTGDTRTKLLALLQKEQDGLAADALADALGITVTAARQHLVSLERDGLVARGDSLPSGGRPQQLFILTEKAREQFPRQYSWFSEVLLDAMRAEMGSEKLKKTLRILGQDAARGIAQEGLVDRMRELGYDAERTGKHEIVAHNCVFHQVAQKHPEVCSFDLGLIGGVTGSSVDHDECIVRGGAVCRFKLKPRPK